MPRLRHFDHLNTARFITFSCYHRQKLLTKNAAIDIFLTSLEAIRSKYSIKLYGYVIMPEHVHLVLHPPDSVKLGPVIGELKSKSASQIIFGKLLKLPEICRVVKNNKERWIFWQPRCYDHNCRTQETVIEKINYCHKNAVVRGLVADPEHYRWSSYNWYLGKDDVPISMDVLE